MNGTKIKSPCKTLYTYSQTVLNNCKIFKKSPVDTETGQNLRCRVQDQPEILSQKQEEGPGGEKNTENRGERRGNNK